MVFSLPVFSATKQYNVYSPRIYKQSDLIKNYGETSVLTKNDVIELIVDYSGSMEPWINQAKSVMVNILPKIPRNVQIGFRAFGSSNLSIINPLAACTNSKLVTPFGTSNANSIYTGMNSIGIGGATPLVYALQQAAYKDLANLNSSLKKKIVLITDGDDTCGGNPCAFVRTLIANSKDIQIDVIKINGGDGLRCLADETGGNYYNINSSQDFGKALGVSFETLPQSTFPSSPNNNYSPYKTNPTYNPPYSQNDKGSKYQFIK